MILLVILSWLTTSRSFRLYVGDACVNSLNNTTGECLPLEACPPAQADYKAKSMLSLCSSRPTVVCCPYQYEQATDPPEESDSFHSRLNVYFKTLEAQRQLDDGIDYLDQFIVGDKISEKRCNQWYPGDAIEQSEAEVIQLNLRQGAHVKEAFPHMAALGWFLRNGSVTFKCAGTLIEERYVLSAAHCLLPARPAFVRLGVDNLAGNLPYAVPIDISVASVIVHPQFKPPRKYYDIALLKLAEAIPINYHVRPACLWTKTNINTYRGAFFTGWGVKMNTPILPSIFIEKNATKNSPWYLQKVKVKLLDTKRCQKLLYYVYNRQWVGLQGHQLCAGVLRTRRDTLASCQSDPGGPLQVSAKKSDVKVYWIIGVTSRDQCGLENKPGIYTRVSSFVPWIESIVWPND